MSGRTGFEDWVHGWSDLARRDGIEGYRALCRWRQFRLDLGAVIAAPGSGAFWRGALLLAAAALAAQILVWDLDLRGWRRDGMQCLPLLLAAPWVAAGRRRLIGQRLTVLAREAATVVTVPCGRPLHSGPGALGRAAERWRWLVTCTARWHREPGPGSAGRISCWPSRVSRSWRRWRCRVRET